MNLTMIGSSHRQSSLERELKEGSEERHLEE
jgi:hypothetical protein